jgi:hypothetical protein
MPPAGFEPAIPASRLTNRVATRIGFAEPKNQSIDLAHDSSDFINMGMSVGF